MSDAVPETSDAGPAAPADAGEAPACVDGSCGCGLACVSTETGCGGQMSIGNELARPIGHRLERRQQRGKIVFLAPPFVRRRRSQRMHGKRHLGGRRTIETHAGEIADGAQRSLRAREEIGKVERANGLRRDVCHVAQQALLRNPPLGRDDLGAAHGRPGRANRAPAGRTISGRGQSGNSGYVTKSPDCQPSIMLARLSSGSRHRYRKRASGNTFRRNGTRNAFFGVFSSNRSLPPGAGGRRPSRSRAASRNRACSSAVT